MFLLLNVFVQKLYARQCANLAFAVYEDNFAAIKFYDKITGQLKTSTKYTYRFNCSNADNKNEFAEACFSGRVGIKKCQIFTTEGLTRHL